MKRILYLSLTLLLGLFVSINLYAQVSNIRVKPEGLEKIVIHYDLSGDGNFEIRLFLKTNPLSKPVLLQHVSGDVGTNIQPGTHKAIEWQATKEFNDLYTDQAEFLIKASPLFDYQVSGVGEQAFGTLDILADGCNIWINDSLAGSNAIKARLAPGTYTLKASRQDENENYLDEIREINLKDNDSLQVELIPRVMSGTINIKSFPPAAEIFLNDSSTFSYTPGSIAVPPGNHHITLKKQGYQDINFNAFIDQNHSNLLFEHELYKGKNINRPVNKTINRAINLDVLKHRRRKTFWLIPGLISSGIGAYAYLEADKKYNAYLEATGTVEASELKRQVKYLDRTYPIVFGVAGFCLLGYIVQSTKHAKAKKQLSFSPSPVKGGGGIKLAYRF